jgi:recombination protein RecR
MPESLKQLINSISYLPWIWEKSATKLAFFLLNSNKNYIENLSNNLKNIKDNVWFCSNCNGLCDKWKILCKICENETRDKDIIAVVEEYLDLLTIEETSWFNWVYHVLWWAISPINWVFIWDLKFNELFKRIENADKKVEIILATNPNIEWEATSNYIIEEIGKRWLKHKTKITRLSRGLSSGYIEYADNITLINAIKDRKEITK